MSMKVRDCAECADAHYVKEMYPKEGSLICKPCLIDSMIDSMNEGE